MIYNPELHTKEYLLKHQSVALLLANNSTEFAKGIGQDESYFTAAFYAAQGVPWEQNPCKVLANTYQWSASPAAQNKNLLSLSFGPDKRISHALWKHDDWASGPIAQDKDVLALGDQNGYAVAHNLVYSEVWAKTPAAQDLDIICALRINKTGEAVAHLLAERSMSWLSTPIAHDRNVISLATLNGETVLDYALKNPDYRNPEQQAELLLRPIRFGDAVFIRDEYGSFSNSADEILEVFMGKANELIEQTIEPFANAQLVAALYSSLINLRSVASHCTELNEAIEKVEPILLKLAEDTSLFSSLLSGHGKHCGPAKDVILKCRSNTIFSSDEQIQTFETEVVVEHPVAGLY